MRQRRDILFMLAEEGTRPEPMQFHDDAEIAQRLLRRCAEVQLALKNPDTPAVLFSATSRPVGKWADLPSPAAHEESHLPFSFVLSADDDSLDLVPIEEGASDFIFSVFFQQNILPVLDYARQVGAAVQRLAAA